MGARGISVVVICWNGGSDVERCLRALVGAPPSRPFEIRFVDNQSSDQSVATARRFEGQVLVHELPANRGFSGAANEGARAGALDYLLFLNTDVTVAPGAVERLAAVFDTHPEAAAVAGKLVGASGEPQRGFNLRRLPGFWSQCLELLLLHRLFPGNPVTRRHRMTDFDYDDRSPSEVEQPAGACLGVRRRVFDELGGFDEAFHPAWFEDVDFCKRLRDRGHRVLFVPDAVFEHRGGASLERMPFSRFLSIWYRNMLLYFRKHHGRLQTWLLRLLVGLGLLARVLLSTFRPTSRRAYWRVFREAFWLSPVS